MYILWKHSFKTSSLEVSSTPQTISLPPLKLIIATGVSSGQWGVNGSDVNSLQVMATPLPLLPSHRLEPNPGPGEATSTNRQRQAHGVGEATRQEKTGFLDDFLGGPGFFLESFINFYLNFLILWLKQHSLYTLLSCPK